MSAGEVQALLRFLTQDAKFPLAIAMSKVRELQNVGLATPEGIAKSKPDIVRTIFPDEKVAKQVLSAAKRVTKKRAAGEDALSSPRKRRKDESLFSPREELSPEQLEASLALPQSTATVEELSPVIVFSNRAPLVLAFVVTLLSYTMPEQPLSSRLSLAQAYVSTTSRSRAVSLGIESGRSAEEEGFGEGQPLVTIMGKDLRVLRRWGYEWKAEADATDTSNEGAVKAENRDHDKGELEKPALWALDLEAIKKSNSLDRVEARAQSATTAIMPIYTPQSARAYLLKSFASPPFTMDGEARKKKPSAAKVVAEKERNLGLLLRAIDLVFQSWMVEISPEELEKRIWGWYVRVRPSVDAGAAGWGGKNEIHLEHILALRHGT